MIIVIDAILSPVKPRGVARYTTELIKGLAELDSENTYYIFYGSWMRSYDFLQVQQPNFHFIEKDIKTGMLPRNLYKCFVLPLLAKKLHLKNSAFYKKTAGGCISCDGHISHSL